MGLIILIIAIFVLAAYIQERRQGCGKMPLPDIKS